MLNPSDLEHIVEHCTEIAKQAAKTEAQTVLHAVIILHLRLANDLVAKGVFTPFEYASSMAQIVKEAERYREETPELFEAISKAARMLEQTFAATQRSLAPPQQPGSPRHSG